MLLDEVVIENLGSTNEEKVDIQSILKAGARAVFEPHDEEKERSYCYDAAAVNKLLDRAQADTEEKGDLQKNQANLLGYARIWANDSEDLVAVPDSAAQLDEDAGRTVEESEFWDKLLKERESEVIKEKLSRMQQFGRGKRVRENVSAPVSVNVMPPFFFAFMISELVTNLFYQSPML